MARDKSIFHFKQFQIRHALSTMKVGTDSVLLGSWIQLDDHPHKILDIGTGCGILALMMAQRFEGAEVLGIDIHYPSLQDFERNIENFPLKNQLRSLWTDFLDFSSEDKFDLILSNPPYFSEALLSDRHDKNRARHQLDLTMDKLVSRARDFLSPQGKLALILPTKEMKETMDYARDYQLYPYRIAHVSSDKYSPTIRMMVEFTRNEKTVMEEHIHIYETDRSYTSQYKELTKDFYLNF